MECIVVRKRLSAKHGLAAIKWQPCKASGSAILIYYTVTKIGSASSATHKGARGSWGLIMMNILMAQSAQLPAAKPSM